MTNNKALLTECRIWNTSKQLVIEQTEKGIQKLFLKGKIQEAEAENQNERFYPMHILEREVENFKKIIASNSTQAIGELDHPENAVVNLENASHIMRDIWWQGREVWGKLEVLNGPDPYGTPKGRILESLIRRGLTVGISSRGVGSTVDDRNGKEVIQDDYQIITFDIVSNPSTRGAFLLKENYAKLSKPLTPKQLDNIKYFKLNNILTKILG